MLFPVVDVYEISKIWSAQGFGHVPWSPDYCFGYGYPYHTFYAPLGFYVGAVLHFLLGVNFGWRNKAELLCFHLPQRPAHVRIHVYDWLARKMAASRLVGASGSDRLRPHEISSYRCILA